MKLQKVSQERGREERGVRTRGKDEGEGRGGRTRGKDEGEGTKGKGTKGRVRKGRVRRGGYEGEGHEGRVRKERKILNYKKWGKVPFYTNFLVVGYCIIFQSHIAIQVPNPQSSFITHAMIIIMHDMGKVSLLTDTAKKRLIKCILINNRLFLRKKNQSWWLRISDHAKKRLIKCINVSNDSFINQ